MGELLFDHNRKSLYFLTIGCEVAGGGEGREGVGRLIGHQSV